MCIRDRGLSFGVSAKAGFSDTDIDTETDILARILADTSDTRDFPREDVGVDVGVVESGLNLSKLICYVIVTLVFPSFLFQFKLFFF